MNMKLELLPLVLGLACLVPQGASAHPSFQVREATIGAPYKGVVSIPHGCEGSAAVPCACRYPKVSSA